MERTCPRCDKSNVPQARFCVFCGAPMDAPGEGPSSQPDPYIGQVLADRYRVQSLLGEGAMSRVYLAEQRLGTTTRRVAVKVLRLDMAQDPELVARFHQECETIVSLTHPNTIQVYDFGELSDGALYLVMEYLEGASLAEVLDRSGPMDPERVERILVQIGGSLHEAHASGIVHRDLKPQNVVLSDRATQRDFVKVLDFGIAKRLSHEDGSALTQRGYVLGTPPYMSPEQFTGEGVDPRTDLYALGTMAYQMITGALPFQARTPWEWAAKHTTEEPSPLEDHPAGARVPERMRRAIMHALAKTPDERPPDVPSWLREVTGSSDLEQRWTRSAAGAVEAPVGAAESAAHAPTEASASAAYAPSTQGRIVVLAAVLGVAAVATGIYLGAGVLRGDEPEGATATAAGPRDAGSEDAGAGSTPDAGHDAGAANPELWFGSVHHVRNASNAQYALGVRDGQRAIIRSRGIVTLELAPGRAFVSDETPEPDLKVYARGGTYRVEISPDHHRFHTVQRVVEGKSVSIDLDSGRHRTGRFVRIMAAPGSEPVEVDAVRASEVRTLEEGAGHHH